MHKTIIGAIVGGVFGYFITNTPLGAGVGVVLGAYLGQNM